MKSNLLQELEQILAYEDQVDMTLPIPTYLFVQKYGRNIEEEMPKIAALLRKKEWFFFKADENQEKSILNRFLVEQECRSSAGREYTGCILIELTGSENEKELLEFFSYMESQKHRLTGIYTTKEAQSVTEMKRLLSGYGFVRRIDGEFYDAFEQLKIFESTINEYQFSITSTTRVKVAEWFRKKEWNEQDAVVMQIQNIAKSVVYQKILEAKTKSNEDSVPEEKKTYPVISAEEIEKAILEFEGREVSKRQIGFALEG